MHARPARDEIDHTPGRAQHRNDVDAGLRMWIDSVTSITTTIPGHRATVRRGSLSTGTFMRPKSDADLLVIVDDRSPNDPCCR